MSIYRFSVHFTHFDPRSAGYLSDARALGFDHLQRIECQDLYFIEGQLLQEELQQLALKLLTDPVTQSATWMELPASQTDPVPASVIVEVALRPGVTDSVAQEITRAARETDMSGIRRAATGLRFLIQFDSSVSTRKSVKESAEKLAHDLLANTVIQHWTIGEIEPSFPLEVTSSGEVTVIPIRESNNDELLTLSKDRRAALDLAEMKAIQAYCQKENRDPTDMEFETIAQTWSEHCRHKTFRGDIRYTVKANGRVKTEMINHLLKNTIVKATLTLDKPWCVSVFHDNAGIVKFDDTYNLCFKAETHNHPCAVEPYGGAETGVGGVIRDILGVGLGAKPVLNTDSFCFGRLDSKAVLPKNALGAERVFRGVVEGVRDYGNRMGIPTAAGGIYFDDGYLLNPLVYVGCAGLIPTDKIEKRVRSGDLIVSIGGRTGRGGIHGATFSSEELSEASPTSAVQIGDPITQKRMTDFLLIARDEGLYNSITDDGAGGLSYQSRISHGA